MLKRLSTTITILATLLVAARADIIINEIVHAASDRQLRWPTATTPKLGTGPAFYETGFDDSAAKGWQSGPGPFGFGTTTPAAPAFGTNTQTQMQNLTPTLYLRDTFTVSAGDAAKTDPLELVTSYNDGFIVYVNGVEIARRWAGPAGQFHFHDQHAYDPDLNATTQDVNLYTETVNLGPANTRLVAGTNVIAVHALNLAYTNANFVFSGSLRIGGASPVTLVNANDTWKFFPGVVEPAGGLYDPAMLFSGRLSVPWGKVAYDDSTWIAGPGPHGQGIAGMGTTVSGVVGATPSLYTRIIFNASSTDAADATPLQLLVDYDDSFVAYINGVEVARANIGTANNFVPRTAVATTARNYAGTQTTFIIDPAKNVLVSGANVLAIQTHNVSIGDSDLAVKADLRIGATGTQLVVNNAASWRYKVGTTEPVVDLDGAIEDNPDAPESVNDWVELHNNGASPVSLNGWALTDSPSTPQKWLFPNVSIPAGGYLVVILDGQNIKSPGTNGYLHADFALDADGEYLALRDGTGAVVHEFLTLPPGSPHHSYGRNALGSYVYFDQATPGAANAGTEFFGIAAAPVPSNTGGFFSAAQSLSFTTTTPGATIRYTDTANAAGPTDGSEPTATTGILYSSAINVPGSRVIRARAFAPGMIPSPVASFTYLIGEPTPRPSLPAVSIIGNQPRSLYRPYGTMAIVNNVAGTSGNFPAGPWSALGDNQQYNNANFRGIWGERPVTWQYIAANGSQLFNFDVGLRMAGSPFTRPRYILTGPNGATPNTTAWSTSNALEKPSMNFYMRDDLGGDPLNFPIIPNSPVTKHSDFRFRGGHNDMNPFMIDEMARRLFVDTGNLGSLGVNTTLYINGQFKGIFNLVQHLRQEWMREAFNSDLDWDVLQVGVPADGDGIAYQEMFTFLRNNPQNVLANYQGMQARLDMVNFVDYLIQNIYTCTGDWPHNNWIAARERSTTGKFRFFTWDAEGAFGSFGLTVTSNNFLSQPQNNGTPGTQSSLLSTTPQTEAITAGARILYTLLRDSPEFKLLFADRIQKHFFNGGALTNAAITARYTALANECSPFISGFNTTRIPNWINGVGDTSRWTITQGGTAPNYTVASTTNAPSRRNVLLDGFTNDQAHQYLPAGFIAGYFKTEGLFPTTLAPTLGQFGGTVTAGYNLTISNPNAGGGTIYYTTNGLDPRLPGGTAQGTVYTGPIPINSVTTVKARVVSPGGEWSPLIEATFRTGTPPTILITEIMYNPPAFTPPGSPTPVDGDEFEFIELKNTGSAPVNLFNVRFTAGIDFTFPAGTTIPAGGFVVLAKNPTQFALKYPGVTVSGQYGPGSSLSNGGETLTLVDAAGDTIMNFTYDDALPWPTAADGSGRSLVPSLPNSNPSPNLSNSWRASTAINGSPGTDDAPNGIVAVTINEILANSDATTTDSVEIYNPSTTETADLSDWWLSDNIGNPQKYRIAPGTTIPPGGYLVLNESQFNTGPSAFAFSSNGEEVILSSGNSAGELTGYSVYAQFGTTEAGTTVARYTNTETPPRTFMVPQISPTLGGPNSGPKIGPVVISEIHYQPSGTASEFIEIRNNGNTPVPLFDPANPTNTWRIDGIEFSFPPGLTIQPREFFIVSAIDPATFRTAYNVAASVDIFGPYAPAELLNTGERIALQKPGTPFVNGSGQTVVPYIDVDFVTYSNVAPWPTSPAGGGRSLERANPNAFGDDKNSWKASSTNSGNVGRFGPVTFANWQSQWFTAAENAISGINSDPDGDGLSNGLEYALGRNPRQPDRADVFSSALEMDGTSGPFLTLSFRRSLSIQSTTFTPEVTAGLGGAWLSGSSNALQVGSAVNNGDGSETLKFRDTTPVSGATQRNIRLKVTLP